MVAYAVVNYSTHKIVGVYMDIEEARRVRDKQRMLSKELSKKYETEVECFYIDKVKIK